MWKKVLALSAGILAVVLLITGIMTAVNADNTGSAATEPAAGMPPGPPPDRGPGAGFNSDILARVAAKLNIDKAALEDAFRQVMLEEQQARTNEMFAAWVKDGKLTQEQADAYKAWLSAKPADMPGFPFFGGANTNMLDRLLKDGKITQSQYDAYKAWIAQKPAVELPKPEKPAGAPAFQKNGNMDQMFAAWVKDGKLTQEQADAYKTWLSARPADMPGFLCFAGAKTDMLDKLLKDGKITQSQYDAYKAWIAQKPAVELPKPERPAGGPPCLKNGASK